MINKLIVILGLALSPTINADDSMISVSALQRENEIKITLKNMSQRIVFISNPEKCGMPVEYVSPISRGSFSAFSEATEQQWKHLVVLTPNAEDRPHQWSWSFTIKGEKSRGRVEKMEISLWIATEEDFKKKTIGSFILKKFPVTIKQG